MALNPPPLKLYDCVNFALNNINEFAKGQGYAMSKFRSKLTSVGVGVGVGAEAVRRPHAEAVAAKSVQVLSHRSLRNPLSQLRSR